VVNVLHIDVACQLFCYDCASLRAHHSIAKGRDIIIVLLLDVAIANCTGVCHGSLRALREVEIVSLIVIHHRQVGVHGSAPALCFHVKAGRRPQVLLAKLSVVIEAKEIVVW